MRHAHAHCHLSRLSGVALLEHMPPVAAKALSHGVTELGTAVRTLRETIGSREVKAAAAEGVPSAAPSSGCAPAQPRSENRTRDGLLEAVDDGPLHVFEHYARAADLFRALQGIDWDAAVAKTGMVSAPLPLHLRWQLQQLLLCGLSVSVLVFRW